MKSTGIVRKIDELGRVVIPVELRRMLDLEIKDSVEIFTENNMIFFKKYEPGCIFCGEARDVVNVKGKTLCPTCIEAIKKTKI